MTNQIGIEVLEPGIRVVITQQIPHGGKTWSIRVVGKVVRLEQSMTGSWFSHSKNKRLWLDRLVIQKDDGELTVCNLDQYTHVEILEDV